MATKRMPIPQFVRELEAALNRGDGYMMGAYGQNPRTGYLDLSVITVKSAWKPTGYFYTQYTGKQRTQALEWRKKCVRWPVAVKMRLARSTPSSTHRST